MFEQYGARVGADDHSQRDYAPVHAANTLELIQNPNPTNLAELSWRVGLTLAAMNFLIIGLASAGANPRAGKAGNLGFAFLTFVVYFNLLVLGKSWIQSGQLGFGSFLVALHGGALALGLLWLTRRHFNWTPRLRRRRTGAPEARP